jgi:hypothetical protein
MVSEGMSQEVPVEGLSREDCVSSRGSAYLPNPKRIIKGGRK